MALPVGLHFRVKDISGMVFGMLTVLRFHDIHSGKARWMCRCRCGNEKPMIGSQLKHNESCGCIGREKLIKRSTIHGMKRANGRTTEYVIWSDMKQRCKNPNDPYYYIYGGKGIKVCQEWESFSTFLSDMGLRPSRKHTLERKDSLQDYSSVNCVWATWLEQANNRSTNRFLTWNGKTLTHAQWDRELGARRGVINQLVRAGNSVDKVMDLAANHYQTHTPIPTR